MADDRTEEEQVEALKRWFGENGVSLLVSIVLVLAVVFGYRTWDTQTREAGEAASAIYENLQAAVIVGPMDVISEENLSTGKFLARQLKTDHGSSTYAHFAALQMAKIAVEKGDLEEAAKQLQWALDNGVDEKIAIITNLRLAKVKFALEQYNEALAQLDSQKPGAHESSYEEARGDIFYASNRMDEAREAYQRAVNLQGDTKKPFTQMKLDDLSAPTSVVAADDSIAVDSTPQDAESNEESDQ
ncbi:MAG: putative negative regulator of RcsB-dependent stress response [Candidatus Azotimanducaceae bacterium]